MKIHKFAPITIIATILSAACAKSEITIDNAWIRTPPPNMNMTAAYLVLHNNTADTITLIGANSDAYADVTVHESRVVDGVSEMIRMRSLSLSAGERLVFRPGGLHLMMTKPTRSLVQGDETTITLQFADRKLVPTQAIVSDSMP